MSGTARIVIRFTHWWLGGTGTSGNRGVDVAAYRDSFGCPALPMTQVQGILRETAEYMCLPEVDLLFGNEGRNAGVLSFPGEATLKRDEVAWFSANHAARKQLFGIVRSTAIDENGVAKTETLRSVEVAVPMTLTGTIRWDDGNDWTRWLDRVAAATSAFGKLKHDGFGRAITEVVP